MSAAMPGAAFAPKPELPPVITTTVTTSGRPAAPDRARAAASFRAARRTDGCGRRAAAAGRALPRRTARRSRARAAPSIPRRPSRRSSRSAEIVTTRNSRASSPDSTAATSRSVETGPSRSTTSLSAGASSSASAPAAPMSAVAILGVVTSAELPKTGKTPSPSTASRISSTFSWKCYERSTVITAPVARSSCSS